MNQRKPTFRFNLLYAVGIAVVAMMMMNLFVTPPEQPLKPQDVSFQEVKTTMDESSDSIAKVIFVKDANGVVQEVRVEFKDEKQAPLKAQVPGEAGTERLLTLTDSNSLTVEAEKPREPTGIELFFGAILGILPFVLILVLFFWIMGKMRGGMGGIGGFGKAKTEKFEPSDDVKTFADVAGCEEAKQEAMDTIRFLRDPSALQELGGDPKKGVLLVGPPGNGKTLLAKAIAGEADAAFFPISASQFIEMFVGVGASRVRDLFNKARENRPAIIFVDEIDAIGRQRGTGMGGGHDEREQTLNQLLVEMDGFVANDAVVVIAATNRPDILDEALTRPGRFDLRIPVDAADKFGRHEILKIHCRSKKLAHDVDLEVIATNTPGFSGAQLKGVTDEGALVALRRIEKETAELRRQEVPEDEIRQQVVRAITMEDLDEGIDRVQMGPAKEGSARRMSDEDMKNTAYHELGHAWVAQKLNELGEGGDPVTKITIIPRARALGYTQALPEGDRFNYTDKQLRARIMMALGGRVAQEHFLNTVDTGAQNDFVQCTNMARRMVTEWGMSELGPIHVGENNSNPFLGRQMAMGHEVGPELSDEVDREWRKIIKECLERTLQLIKEDEACFHEIAQVLIEKETILGPEFCELRANSDCAIKPCPNAESEE